MSRDERAPESSSSRRTGTGSDEISLVEVANALLRNRRLIVVWAVAVPLLVVAVTLLLPRTYTTQASFLPQGAGEGRAQITGLAAQFGIATPSMPRDESPRFYADLLRSREILGRVVDSTFTVRDGPGGDWAEIFDIDRGSPERSRAKAIEDLRDRVSVGTGAETGVVEVSVTTPWPTLSHDVAVLLVELVNEFNLERRRSQASEERAFVDGRLEELRAELREAERELQGFLETNRQFQDSPSLLFEHDRLQRDVLHRQEVVTSLTQSFEQARIDEVRTTPVITLVESPYVPEEPDARGLPLRAGLGLLLGTMIGVFTAFGREAFRRADEGRDDEAREFVRLRREAAADLRRPHRLLFSRGDGERATTAGSRAGPDGDGAGAGPTEAPSSDRP